MEEIAILNVPLPTNIHTWHYMLPPLNPDGMYINTLSFLSIICLCLQTWVPPSLSLSFTLYIYTHEKRYPTYTHKEREQMIDNLTEKRCACRPISRCGLKAKKFSFFDMGSSENTIASEYLDLFTTVFKRASLAIKSSDYKKIVFFTIPRCLLLVCLTQNQGQLPPVCVCAFYLLCMSLGEKKENLSLSSSPRALESCNLIFFLKTLNGVVHTHRGRDSRWTHEGS